MLTNNKGKLTTDASTVSSPSFVTDISFSGLPMLHRSQGRIWITLGTRLDVEG